jgi:HAE1 family hydrophobic/amphiphilic exporter-1
MYIIPKGFLPLGDSSFIQGLMIAQEGTSPARMHELQLAAEKAMQEDPNVRVTFTAAGVSGFLTSNQGFLLAFLKEPNQRVPMQVPNPDGTMQTIEKPGIQDIAGSMMMRANMNLQGAIAPMAPNPVLQISVGAASRGAGQYSYAISGIDPKEVYAASGALVGMMYGQQGKLFSSVNSDLFTNSPQLRIDILREKAASYGVTPTQIETLLRNAYSQNYVYLIKQPQDQYQVILEVNDSVRVHPEDLELLYVRSDRGEAVPLSAVAKWEPVVGLLTVNHINQFTSVTINFNLMPGVPIGDATKFIEDSAKQVVPAHLRSSFQGEALTFRETLNSMTILIVLAVFVMYVILAILYESYLHPITVLSTLPTAMVGGLATLFLYGFLAYGHPVEASLYAFIGLFMLMGIVKKNGIMIVDFAIQRVAEGETAEQSIHDASMDRFRPIMMTTLAAVMGAVPIALGWGADGESRRPLGLVIVGGLLVSQLITLYITPVIYLYMELFQEKVLNRIPFFAAHYEGHAVQHQHARHDEAEQIPEARIAEEPAGVRRGNGNGAD